MSWVIAIAIIIAYFTINEIQLKRQRQEKDKAKHFSRGCVMAIFNLTVLGVVIILIIKGV